jgi:hypothetical protein
MMQRGAALMGQTVHVPFCRNGRWGFFVSVKSGASFMIESIMYFGLGFCAAGLSVVLFVPLVPWPRRAADDATA